jgi:hypothetical protein
MGLLYFVLMVREVGYGPEPEGEQGPEGESLTT